LPLLTYTYTNANTSPSGTFYDDIKSVCGGRYARFVPVINNGNNKGICANMTTELAHIFEINTPPVRHAYDSLWITVPNTSFKRLKVAEDNGDTTTFVRLLTTAIKHRSYSSNYTSLHCGEF
jgi:hypothetical protein